MRIRRTWHGRPARGCWGAEKPGFAFGNHNFFAQDFCMSCKMIAIDAVEHSRLQAKTRAARPCHRRTTLTLTIMWRVCRGYNAPTSAPAIVLPICRNNRRMTGPPGKPPSPRPSGRMAIPPLPIVPPPRYRTCRRRALPRCRDRSPPASAKLLLPRRDRLPIERTAPAISPPATEIADLVHPAREFRGSR